MVMGRPRTELERKQTKYRNHMGRAARRGVEFLLTFEEWYKIWQDSGHYHEMGRRGNQYCMARTGDKGPYAVGNVRITTCSENSRECFTRPEILAKSLAARQATRGRPRPKMSLEARAKMRAAKLGKKQKPQHVANMIAAVTGRKFTAEHRAKIGAAQIGNKRGLGYRHTAEAKRKISKAHKGKQWFLGGKHTIETRARMSVAIKTVWAKKRALGVVAAT